MQPIADRPARQFVADSGTVEKAGAAVVLVDGRPAAMITAQDVLAFLAGSAA